MSSIHATDEAFWERIRDAYPRQQPMLNLNNAAVSPPPHVVEGLRVSPHIYMLKCDPDLFVDALRQVTRHG